MRHEPEPSPDPFGVVKESSKDQCPRRNHRHKPERRGLGQLTSARSLTGLNGSHGEPISQDDPGSIHKHNVPPKKPACSGIDVQHGHKALPATSVGGPLFNSSVLVLR